LHFWEYGVLITHVGVHPIWPILFTTNFRAPRS